ncbi:uncharacterized protein LOC133522326 [Cydia pomonella]|uniref:uncharacterized protein LOC133522326 n=1 Tax=Cydia pomonella TaxID=82600 RepID=UPI002ADDAEEE|nr:uncharacterized protein LOC133522326 [Cydia pomonella]
MTEKVWLRFETKTKEGTALKLRIQDLPPERVDEAMELRLKHFAADEVVHKAAGITKNPEAVEAYKEYLNMLKQDPRRSTVICCEDNGEDVGDILGVSSVSLVNEDFNWDQILEMIKKYGREETKKLTAVFKATSDMYKPVEELNLKEYLDDDTVLVMPGYRGCGIAQQFLKMRRLQCAELGVFKTGGWMTGYGTQIAADRDGWETVFEVKYDDLAREHDLVFEDAPPTMKYMIAGPLTSSE